MLDNGVSHCCIRGVGEGLETIMRLSQHAFS